MQNDIQQKLTKLQEPASAKDDLAEMATAPRWGSGRGWGLQRRAPLRSGLQYLDMQIQDCLSNPSKWLVKCPEGVSCVSAARYNTSNKGNMIYR